MNYDCLNWSRHSELSLGEEKLDASGHSVRIFLHPVSKAAAAAGQGSVVEVGPVLGGEGDEGSFCSLDLDVDLPPEAFGSEGEYEEGDVAGETSSSDGEDEEVAKPPGGR